MLAPGGEGYSFNRQRFYWTIVLKPHRLRYVIDVII
jgi:hypothetical protein